MGADVYDARWRIKTAAIAIVMLVLTPVLGARWDLPWVFMLPGLLGGTLLLASTTSPELTLPWRRGQRRGAWHVAGRLSVPLFGAAFTLYFIWLARGDMGRSLVVALLGATLSAVVALVTLRQALRALDEPEPERDG